MFLVCHYSILFVIIIIRQLAKEEEKTRQSIVEQKRLLKEQAEMKREAELEEKKMNKLRKQYEV